MTEIIASPSTRRMARDQQVDLDDLAKKLRRTTIGPEDISAKAPAPATGDTGYWNVDHSQYGPVTTEPTRTPTLTPPLSPRPILTTPRSSAFAGIAVRQVAAVKSVTKDNFKRCRVADLVHDADITASLLVGF